MALFDKLKNSKKEEDYTAENSERKKVEEEDKHEDDFDSSFDDSFYTIKDNNGVKGNNEQQNSINSKAYENNDESYDDFDDNLYENNDDAVEDKEVKDDMDFAESFNGTDYSSKQESLTDSSIMITDKQLKLTIDSLAKNGNSIVVTGCGGCGTSNMAYNIANVLRNMGYTILLVDLDTEEHMQGYMTKDNYDSIDKDDSNVKIALNYERKIQDCTVVARRGLHIITSGIAEESYEIADVVDKERVAQFMSSAKSVYNFVIYDINFKSLSTYMKDLIIGCDNLVMTIDASNWGIIKAVNTICNVEDDDIVDILFSKMQLLFNRYDNFSRLLGTKVKLNKSITKAMDNFVVAMTEQDIGYYFSDMKILGAIPYDNTFEKLAFSNTQYSDTKDGKAIFMNIVKSILVEE